MFDLCLTQLKINKASSFLKALCYFGRDDKIRTCDPLHPMQVRYQAAPHPDVVCSFLNSWYSGQLPAHAWERVSL